MGFLKSLSQSIKRSAIQQSSKDSVPDSEFAAPNAQSTETNVDTAGIKRPSGHGEIARRERRRSSTIGIFSFRPIGSENKVSPQSAADDSRVGSQRQRDERVNRKIIRKTRSFSDVLSRNRKGRTEADGNPVTKPLITWNTPKQSVKERDRDNDAPLPVPLIPTTRKQSGNLLKSAVDIFQFRKTRPSSEPNSGQGSPSDHNEQDGSHETSVAVDVANEAPSVSVGPLPAPHALGEEQVKARASSTILQRPLDNPLERLRYGDINDRFDSDGGPAEVWSRIGHSVKTVESRSQRDAPPFSALAESTLQIEESHMSQKPTSNSRARSGTTTPSDWEFKRPQIGSRAQSTIWLASASLASPEKKRSTLIRRLSAGLIAPLDEKDDPRFQTSPQELQKHQSDYFGEPDSRSSVNVTPTIPDRYPEETTELWMARLTEVVKRTEIAAVLASKQDLHFREALDLLLDGFNFDNLPLDIALRRFLLEMILPREAQQIDRVLEAFAKRYNACHPGLFRDADHAYILAFSLIMLHTDVYNRNNKQKMTKAEYVRNTRLEGVSPAVLEVFHENTCHTEFVFAGNAGGLGDCGSGSRPRANRRSSLFFQAKGSQEHFLPHAGEKGGCRLQAAVVKGDISPLQISSTTWIPKEDPMSYIGNWRVLDRAWVEGRFRFAPAIDVVKPAISTRKPDDATTSVLRLKVIKAGLLSRKDDFAPPGRKNHSKKWRSWSVILTNTQLIFLKDTIWALTLNEQIERLNSNSALSPGTLLLSTFTDFKPDEVIGLTESAAVYDRSYAKYENAFRLAMPHGHEYLLQANDESEMNEWVSLINWSAASKTLGISTTSTPMPSPSVTPSWSQRSTRNKPGGDAARLPFALQASADPELDRSALSAPSDTAFEEDPLIKQYDKRSTDLMKKIEEELRLARNLELLALISRSSQEHITSLLLLMAENIRRWRAELARLNTINIRLTDL
ncbi:hypothetical protein NCC49_001125 [Naganishia albida]|nr:hypothetical protein NCC49_001125 [Naganishia albida]